MRPPTGGEAAIALGVLVLVLACVLAWFHERRDLNRLPRHWRRTPDHRTDTVADVSSRERELREHVRAEKKRLNQQRRGT